MARFSLSSHPWELISVHHVHNSTVSKQLRYSLTRESVHQPFSWDKPSYAVAKKYIDNCYTIGYNSNTWFGYVLYPLIYHAVSATNPIVC